MAPPQRPPMRPRHFHLHVYSVVEKDDGSGWLVRAREMPSDGPLVASLFYKETEPDNLPPMNSVIRAYVDDRTEPVSEKDWIPDDQPGGRKIRDDVGPRLYSEDGLDPQYEAMMADL